MWHVICQHNVSERDVPDDTYDVEGGEGGEGGFSIRGKMFLVH